MSGDLLRSAVDILLGAAVVITTLNARDARKRLGQMESDFARHILGTDGRHR